jgi:hypothetical protein
MLALARRDASLVMGQLLPDGRIGVAVLDTYSSQVAVDELAIAASIKKWADLYFPRCSLLMTNTLLPVSRKGYKMQAYKHAMYRGRAFTKPVAICTMPSKR